MGSYTAERMREYQNRRRAQLRTELLAMLGGKCVRCGVTDALHFDHINPESKLFEIASGLDKPRKILLAEVAKCQLLCRSHHNDKTAEELRGRVRINVPHGEQCSWTKLTEVQVREVLSSSLSHRELAEKFGVGRTTIQAIRLGRSWGHLARVEQSGSSPDCKSGVFDTGSSNLSPGT